MSPEPDNKKRTEQDDALFSFEGFPDPGSLANAEKRDPVAPIPSPEIPDDIGILPDPALMPPRKTHTVPPLIVPEEPRKEDSFAAPEISSEEIYRVESPKKLFQLDYILAGALGLMGFLAVIMTYAGIGFTWDESYYVRPGMQTLGWVKTIFSSKEKPFSQASIDQYFSGEDNIPELPMVPKLVYAAGFWLDSKLNFDKPYKGMRIPIAACFGLTLTLLYLLAGKYYARTGAILTVLCYMTIPRVFGHAHIAGTETILIFFTVLFTYCFVKGLDDWRWALAAGVAYGFCLATKVNAIFLPVVLLLWAQIFQRRFYANNVFSIIFVAPVVMFLIWPWLWPDPFGRFLEYLSFFAQHKMIPVIYFGVKYPFITADQVQNVPWHYPFILTAFTTPTLVMVLAVVGLARTLRNLKNHDIGMLFLLSVLVPLTPAAMPFTPKYDGVRLFLPVFPFVALLAGIGGEGICATIRGFRTARKRYAPARFAAEAISLAVLGYGVIVMSKIHPHELSYWNLMFNGIVGAQRAGMETTYWGDAVNEDVYDYLNDLPDGTRVQPLAMHPLKFTYLQDWDVISKNITFDAGEMGDIILLQMREGFLGPRENILVDLFERGALGNALVSYRGVPFVVAFDLRNQPLLRNLLEPPVE